MYKLACEGPQKDRQWAHVGRAWSEEGNIICEVIDVTATRPCKENYLCSQIQNGQEVFSLKDENLKKDL